MKHQHSYIDGSIILTEKLPDNITQITKRLDEYDHFHPELYFNYIDDLVTNAKNACAANVISRQTHDRIFDKYIVHALDVAEREDNNGSDI